MPTSDLKIWQSRQTERLTDCANSVRDNSPRTSSRIISMIFSTLLSKAAPWGDSYPKPVQNDDTGKETPSPILLEVREALIGSGQTYSVAKLSRANYFDRIARCDSPSQRNTGRFSIRRSRLFTTADKKLSTRTQICDYFARDVYIQTPVDAAAKIQPRSVCVR